MRFPLRQPRSHHASVVLLSVAALFVGGIGIAGSTAPIAHADGGTGQQSICSGGNNYPVDSYSMYLKGLQNILQLVYGPENWCLPNCTTQHHRLFSKYSSHPNLVGSKFLYGK